MVGTAESTASLGCAPSYPEIPVYRMESIAGIEHEDGSEVPQWDSKSWWTKDTRR